MDISKAGKPTEYTFVDGKRIEKVDPSRKDVAKKLTPTRTGAWIRGKSAITWSRSAS
ncbi:MAG: hypothetical protein V2A78_02955 [bacterium]